MPPKKKSRQPPVDTAAAGAGKPPPKRCKGTGNGAAGPQNTGAAAGNGEGPATTDNAGRTQTEDAVFSEADTATANDGNTGLSLMAEPFFESFFGTDTTEGAQLGKIPRETEEPSATRTGAAVGRGVGLTQHQNAQDNSRPGSIAGDICGTQPSIDRNLVHMLRPALSEQTLPSEQFANMGGLVDLVKTHINNFKKVFHPTTMQQMAPNRILTVGTMCTGSAIDAVLMVAMKLALKEENPGFGIRYLFNCEKEPWKRKWIYQVHKALEEHFDQ